MRRKVPKENLLSGAPGGDYVDFIVNNDQETDKHSRNKNIENVDGIEDEHSLTNLIEIIFDFT